ncbi:MAG: hypothetical protein PUA81_09655 [Oscillospiraceae bacterium]|nr:hypothetical protein [Oscillospiraceae bacterium]
MENERKSNKIDIDDRTESTKELLKDFGIIQERRIDCGKINPNMGKI